MGAGESTLAVEGQGLHVLGVQPNSPGEKAGLEAYFDFIVSVGDLPIAETALPELELAMQEKMEESISIKVFNSKARDFREVTIIPSDKWGGEGVLGVDVTMCNYTNANKHVWRVLTVEPNSPAALAGLVQQHDYIIGGPNVVFTTPESLHELIQQNFGKEITMYVYNSVDNFCREVQLIPMTDWGGEGSLGCKIGYGSASEIPVAPPFGT